MPFGLIQTNQFWLQMVTLVHLWLYYNVVSHKEALEFPCSGCVLHVTSYKFRAMQWYNMVPFKVKSGSLTVAKKKLKTWVKENVPIDWGQKILGQILTILIYIFNLKLFTILSTDEIKVFIVELVLSRKYTYLPTCILYHST